MDKQIAGKAIYRMNSQLHLHSYDNAAEILANINSNLYPSFCIPTSRDYNPTYAQDLVFCFTVNLIESQNPNLQKEAQHFIQRWSYLISSISPLDFLSNIQALFSKDEKHSNLFYIFLPALSNAVSSINDDEILHNFPFIQKLFHAILQTNINEIPASIWQVIGKYSIEEEITQLLQNNLDISFASTSSFLIQKDPKKYSSFLFKKASSDYLNEFLKNYNKCYEIDIDEGIKRVCNDCTQLGIAGFNSTCFVLSNILHFYEYDFSEEQKNQIKSLFDKMLSFLSDEKINANDTNAILLTLYEGAQKKLFEKEQLKKLMPNIQLSNECHQLQITCLKIDILCLEKDSDNSETQKRILKFTSSSDQIYIQFLEVIGENYDYIKDISPKFAIDILWSILHPLPLDSNLAVSIVKLLLKLDPSDVLESDVDSRLDFLFSSYLNQNNIELTNLTIKLAKLYNYSPPVTKIDLFGKFNEKQISLLTNVDPNFVKELITSKLLEPSSLHSLLTVMQQHPNRYTDFVGLITSTIYSIGHVLGIRNDIDSSLWKCSLKKPEVNDEIISHDDIKKLFDRINGPIEESEFGTFLSSSIDTLSILSTNDFNRTKIHHSEIAKAALIASHFVLVCPRQVLNFLTRLQSYRTSKKESEGRSTVDGYNEAFKIVESIQIPAKYSIEVVLYSKERFGNYAETVKRFPKHVSEALGKSRMICDMFINEIKQPLQPLKTFLSFIGMKEHEDWVEVCKYVIPPHEWMIGLNDSKVIDGMKDLSEQTRRILNQKLTEISRKPKTISNVKESFLEQSSSFQLKNSLYIASAPKIHLKDNKSVKPGEIEISQLQALTEDLENDAGTLYDVISFLWHSNLDLPDTIKPEDLENLAFKNRDNPQMLVGFFSWANLHDYKINLAKWKSEIHIDYNSDMWLLSVALFASNIHCSFDEIPQEIFSIFKNCFTSFGYPTISKASLVNCYYHLTGVKWLLVHNIISIDPSYFGEYPLIVAEITNNMDLFKEYFDNLDTGDSEKVNFYSFIGINDILFNPSGDQMILSSLLPTNRSFNSRILSFKEISRIPAQVKIPNELLESIINCLQKAKNVSYNYFAFFMNIEMTKEQFNRVYDIFFKDRDSSDMNRKFLLPSLFVSDTGKSAYLEDEAIRFYSNKPPSLTRAFFRSLLCCFAPPVNQDLIVKIESKLEVVFPDLCYCGFAKSGIRMWEDSLPISKLRFGYIDNNIGSSLLNNMKIPCAEALDIYRLLSLLSDDELAIAQPWATKGMIREEISHVLLDTATSESSYAFFAHKAVSLICDSIGIEDAMVLIANKDLFERPNFLCAIVAFQYLLKRAQKENNQNVVDFIQVIQNPETNIIDKEDRKKIFLSINTCDSLSNLIHRF